MSSPAARDFVTNAYAHSKFIGYVSDAVPLFEATGIDRRMDDGFIEIGNGSADPAGFLSQCRQLRYWPRETASANGHRGRR